MEEEINRDFENDIFIEESFSDDDFDLFEKIEKKSFESKEMLDLRLDIEELTKDSDINELISHEMIKKNLAYDLHYQKDGALKLIRDLNCTGLLADEVGLGKTITAGMVLKECVVRGLVKNILILVPPSLVDQWVAELRDKFDLDFTIVEDEGSWRNGGFMIASIDRVKIFDRNKGDFRHSQAHEIPWDLLVVDEAHKLKSRGTVRWKFVDKLQKKRFLILTATPFQNDLIELYNLLHLLKRGHLGTIKEFRKKFLNRGNKRYPLNPKDLRKKLDEIMVRRRRSQTGINYKKRIPRIISVNLTKEEKEIYDATCDLLKTQYFSADGDSINGRLIVFAILPKITSSKKSAIESLSRIVSSEKYHEKTKEIARRILRSYESLGVDSKMKKLVNLIKEIKEKDPEDKILIYTRHPTTLRYIIENLKDMNLKIMEFVGGLTREEKSDIVAQFKDDADILISTDTGAEGLNFQFCRNLINYDLPWNPMAVEQRIGRLDRIGQERDMNIYSFATKDTMEEQVVDLIINKMCCVGLVIGELPIILFNLGLDERTHLGMSKIEERIMSSFIDSKNNLDIFSRDIRKIEDLINSGIEEYSENKENTKEFLDDEQS